MESDDGVASAGGFEVLPVVSGLSIGDAIPDIAVAALIIEVAEDGVVDGKVESDNGVTAVDILEGLDKVT